MNELYHHGIKGMHWGVRRYQNPDGTLTAAGKRRERSEDKAARNEAKRQRMWNAKNSALLSDEELTNQIVRLQKETQLKDLTNQAVSPGRKRAKEFLLRNGELILSTAIAAGVTARVNQGLKPKDSTESIYRRRKKELDVDTQLASEGYPVSKKGYDFDSETKTWRRKTGDGKH